MTTVASRPHFIAEAAPKRAKRPAAAPLAPISDAEMDRRLGRVSRRAVAAIVAGVTTVACILAVILIGWELAILGTVGIALTALLFGSPFWIAAVDAEVERERARLTGADRH